MPPLLGPLTPFPTPLPIMAAVSLPSRVLVRKINVTQLFAKMYFWGILGGAIAPIAPPGYAYVQSITPVTVLVKIIRYDAS